MSLHDGLDLSRFTRVSGDKKTTTLRHRNGHELKIANSALTPKMRAKIDGLQAHEEPVKMYAEGTPDEPVSATDGAPTLAPAAAPLDPASPAPVAEQTLAPAAQPVAQPAVAPGLPPKPAVMPSSTVDVVGAPRVDPEPAPPPPAVIAQQMTDQNLQFQQDLAKGHVQPKTIQDLYNDKSTLGKIGTLFGLLLSGAGSGLTKQPNAVLEMMNREIERDYDAQKTKKTNAQNWYKLGLEHAMNEANIGLAEAQTMNQYGQVQLIPSQIEANKAQASAARANAALAGGNLGLINAKLAAFQTLQDQVDRLPPGADKAAAQEFLGQVNQGLMTNIQTSNLQTASQIQARNALAPQAQKPEADSSGVDFDKLTLLKQTASSSQDLGFVNKFGVSPQDMDKAEEEASLIAQNRSAAKLYSEAFHEMASKVAGNRLNPAEYKAQTEAISEQIARIMGNTSGDAVKRIQDSMFPNWDDFLGEARSKKYENAIQKFESNEKSAITLGRLNRKVPGLLKPFPYATKMKSSDPLEGRTANNGKLIRRNGKWEPNATAKK
jgi:hypothetical protein